MAVASLALLMILVGLLSMISYIPISVKTDVVDLILIGYVVWPYADVEDTVQLMPSSPSVEYFPYAQRIEPIDQAFPRAWEYLTTPAVERILRQREGGSFRRGLLAHRWYGFSAPRSLQLYTGKKFCLPELTRIPDGALEDEGGSSFKRGASPPSFYSPPLLEKERGIKGVRLINSVNELSLDKLYYFMVKSTPKKLS
jgi:hypothetical protein